MQGVVLTVKTELGSYSSASNTLQQHHTTTIMTTTPVPLAPLTEEDAIHAPTNTSATTATTGNNNNNNHGPSDERSEDTANDGLPFPPPFFDAFTGNLLEFPVVNPEGNSVEKMPGMEETTYYPNRALQAIITKELSLSENSVTGSLRR